MKLEKILDQLGSLEKNAFIKVIDNIISDVAKKSKEVDKILDEYDKGLKNADSQKVSKIFNLIKEDFASSVKAEFEDTNSQFDFLIDIISRDGNCIMKQDWFSRLYESELKNLKAKIKSLKAAMEDDKSELSDSKRRDYNIYKACVDEAFNNDKRNNRECKITSDELSILIVLAKKLKLSQEEVKLLNYMVVPLNKMDIDSSIDSLRRIGVIFYSKKTSTLYVADEMVKVLRSVRGKEVADKYFRRVLKSLRDPQINLISKVHGIDKNLTIEKKIKAIINDGVSLSGVLSEDLYKDGTNVSDRKKFINEFWEKSLKIPSKLKGTTIDDKIDFIIEHFEHIENDEKVGMSIDGYERLVNEIGQDIPKLNTLLKEEFEIQDENVLNSELLLDYNLKPIDVLDLLSDEELLSFCTKREIKSRGDKVFNILENYKDTDNIFLENYENIGFRNYNELKENGLNIKEADIGNKFEELTRKIFSNLGFVVDEKLKKKINTTKDKLDILINLGNNEVLIIECKTNKESGYNKFSSVSRQVKAYNSLAVKNGLNVKKTLLVAPDFSDDFISECEIQADIDLSLLKASSLIQIMEGFKLSKSSEFPVILFLRDVLINEERVLKALNK